MDIEAVSNCVGPLSRDYLSKLPHHVAPCMNLHRVFPGQETSNFGSSLLFSPFPYASTLPVPFTPLSAVERPILNGIDPTTSLIKEKIKWQLKKEKIVRAVQKDKKSIKEKLIKKAAKAPVDSKTVVPLGVALLAQHLDRDPDPCFSGVNNWYYSGGTVATFEANKDHYLLHASDNKLNCSKVVDQTTSERLFEVNLLQEPIHQVVTNQKGAAVRQKTQVSVFAADESEHGELRLSEALSVSDNCEPFLSVALRGNSVNKFCTLGSVKSFRESIAVVKLWDVEYKKKCKEQVVINQEEGATVADNWSCIEFVDNQTLLLANRCCVCLLDARAGFAKKHLAWCPKKLLETCEEISHVTQSCARDQVVYTATSHQALCLDLRYGFLQRWTHMMAAPPQFGFTKMVEDRLELLCLGSQVMSDCVVVVNSWEDEDPKSVYKPSSLHPPAKSLYRARQHGLCLDPTLSQRCSQSMTGLTWLPAECGVHVVRQSATADVFIQHLTRTDDVDEEMNQNRLTAFSEWCRPPQSLQTKATTAAVEVTKVENLSSIVKALRDPQLPIQKGTDEETLPTGMWQMSKKYMEACVDMLASQMLAVWEVDDEEEWVSTGDKQDDSLIEQDPSEKVLDWLDKAGENDAAVEPTNAEMTDTDMTNAFGPGVMFQKGKVTSTPFPQPASPAPSEYGVRMTQPPIGTHLTPHRTPPSPSHSNQSRHKRRKLLQDSAVKLNPSQPTSSSKLQDVKKKYIPGF